MGLVHLDIKPENIFITLAEPHLTTTISTISEDDSLVANGEDQSVYKIGKHMPTCTILVMCVHIAFMHTQL